MAAEMELYLHIPFCVKKCDYCDFLSGRYDERTQHAYTLALCDEIRFMGRQMAGKMGGGQHGIGTSPISGKNDDTPIVRSIFIGGGTPSWLDAGEMERILQTVRASFALKRDAEITIECNPGTVTREKLLRYRANGINRLSIGLQSANDGELKLLGRIHTFGQFLKTYELARETGFDNINVDVMTGLPGQTWEKLKTTLSAVIRLKPEHISSYGLMIEEGTPFYQRYQKDAARRAAGEETESLPDEEEEYLLGKRAAALLQEHGYHQYEISNFAREGRECVHNLGYWQRVPYLGLGLGASSLMGERRCSNLRDMDAYIRRCGELEQFDSGSAAVSREETEDAGGRTLAESGNSGQLTSPLWESCEKLSREDAMEEFMFLGLRVNRGISAAAFSEDFGRDIAEVYGPILERLQKQGFLLREGDRIFLTEKGRDLSNVVLAEFLL